MFLFAAFILLLNLNAIAQWQTDSRLTNDPSASYTSINNAHCIASNGNFVHVTWYDNRDGNSEIYYKRSNNRGISWGTDTRLSNDPNTSNFHSIAVSGQYVYVVWEENRDGNREIYYKRSTDEGESWGLDTRLTNNSSPSGQPSINACSSNVHIVWRDDRMGNLEVFYKRSTDYGTTWGNDTLLSDFPNWSWLPSVAVTGQYVHVVWNDQRNGSGEIYYKGSTDGGISWDIDKRLSNNPLESYNPTIAAEGLLVNVVWQDRRDGNYEIYYIRSTDGGMNWGTETRLTNDFNISYYPSLAVSGSSLHLVWQDIRSAYYGIYYKQSTDAGINWSADSTLSNSTGSSIYPSIAVSGSFLHVLWTDDRDGNNEIYYKNNPNGNPIGIIPINTEIPKEFRLEQNYPNPFNPSTRIKFSLPNSSFATLVVYDMLGRKMETLVNEQLSAGTYEAEWNASGYSSGVYFYRIKTEGFTDVRRMILIK